MEMDLVVRGGRVARTNVVEQADLGIKKSKIAVVGNLEGVRTTREIDATGLLVLPGGVDPHTHVRWPFLDVTSNDDFAEASIAALHGGTTSIIDWALPADESALEGIDRRIKQALSDGVLVDFGLHCVLGPAMKRGYEEIPEAIGRGLPTFKCYLTYRRRGLLTDDAGLVSALRLASVNGGIVGVHAENPTLHETAEAEFRVAGKHEPKYFRLAKDNLVEASAIAKAIYLAGALDAPLMIQHISTREAVQLVRQARQSGVKVFAETCPHYLTLTDEVYERPDGRRFICSPPIKSKEDQEALWEGVADGTISVIGADHCAFTLADKAMGTTAFDVPNGLPGIETRLPLLYHFGVMSGRIDEQRFCAVIAENPARIAGLFPNKGIIAVGSDADLVIVDPRRRNKVTAEKLHQATDWTPYEGMELNGYPPVYTILRGEVVVDDGAFHSPSSPGHFLPGEPGGYQGVR